MNETRNKCYKCVVKLNDDFNNINCTIDLIIFIYDCIVLLYYYELY